jgi:hypothetical protein
MKDQAQGRFVPPGGAPALEEFYRQMDADPKFWSRSLDPADLELERLFALEDPRE